MRYAHATRRGAGRLGRQRTASASTATLRCIQMPASGSTRDRRRRHHRGRLPRRLLADRRRRRPGRAGRRRSAAGLPDRSRQPPVYQLTFRGGTPKRFGLPRNYVGTSMSAAHVSGVAAMVIASRVVGPEPDARPGRRPAPEGDRRDLGAPGEDTCLRRRADRRRRGDRALALDLDAPQVVRTMITLQGA